MLVFIFTILYFAPVVVLFNFLLAVVNINQEHAYSRFSRNNKLYHEINIKFK